ncbi:hypothetical protein HanIR_Chr08g0350211 [Helianthus annuus]|nr:hypothetical protein HanIR_Chr08g0350211 [Helianthus annuus]
MFVYRFLVFESRIIKYHLFNNYTDQMSFEWSHGMSYIVLNMGRLGAECHGVIFLLSCGT